MNMFRIYVRLGSYSESALPLLFLLICGREYQLKVSLMGPCIVSLTL